MVFAPVERLIAWRYLRARREEGFISVIAGFSLVGIALGVGTLIVVMSVMNGFQIEMMRQMSSISGQLGVQAPRDGIDYSGDFVPRLRSVPGVVTAVPIVEGQMIVVAGEKVRGVLLRGIGADDLRARTPLSAAVDGPPGLRERYRGLCRAGDQDAFDWGTLKTFGDDGFTLAIGRRLADLLNVKVGDRLQIVSPVSISTPLGTMPRSAQARVGAVFCAGMYDYDSNFIYAPMAEVQRLLGTGERATSVEVFLAEGASAREARRQLSQAVGLRGFVFDWFEANIGFFAAIKTQSNVIFIILTLIIVVAAFNIVSSLVMLVRTKTADIAILRTMGASRGAVMRIFLLDGIAIGGIGTVIGVALGVAFARNIEALRQWLQRTFDIVLFDETLYLLAELPARIDAGEVLWIAAMAILFALAASLYPAVRASRLDPVEGLHRE
jgi:lipoprotein-releasing system permease protein